jgi:hypothetical protein
MPIYTSEECIKMAELKNTQGALEKSKDEYNMDSSILQKWSDMYEQMCVENKDVVTIAKIFAECATYISFTEFKANMLSAFQKFLNANKDQKYVMVYTEPSKSNFWVCLLLLHNRQQLQNFRPPSYVFNNFNEFYSMIKAKDERLSDYMFVYVDDASYSGDQLYETIQTTCHKTIPVSIVVSAMSSWAEQRISNVWRNYNPGYNRINDNNSNGNSKKIVQPVIYKGMTLETIPEILRRKARSLSLSLSSKKKVINSYVAFVENSEYVDSLLNIFFLDFVEEDDWKYSIDVNIPVYFEHKMPDARSSYPSMFMGHLTTRCSPLFPIVKNCKLKNPGDKLIHGSSVNNSCAKPFYKMKGSGVPNKKK